MKMVAITEENIKFLVTCLECQKSMKRITNTHLKRCCDMSMTQYAEKYNISKKNLLWIPERNYHSKSMAGEGNSTYGMVRTQDWRDKISKGNSGKKNYKLSATRLRIKRERGYLQSKEARIKQSNSLRKKFSEDSEWSINRKKEISTHFKNQWLNPEKKDKHLQNLGKSMALKPNKPEKKIRTLITQFSLDFKYVGDFSFWIHSDTHSFNPDFINHEKKVIIEVFGDYWHNKLESIERDKKRLETYEKQGYRTLIIWEKEINKSIDIELYNKIYSFLNKNVEIKLK